MGKMGNIAFVNSFINETRKTQRELTNIQVKREERRQKDELFTLQKKKYEAEIKAKEADGTITPFDAKAMINEFKDYSTMLKADSDLQHGMLDQAQTQNQKKQQRLGSVARQIMPQLTIKTDEKGRKSSTMTFKPETSKGSQPKASDKALGALQQGGLVTAEGYVSEFDDREQAEAFAATRLGPDYKTKYPRAEEFINNKFPIEKIKVISPDGKAGFIPSNKLNEALKRGFKRGN